MKGEGDKIRVAGVEQVVQGLIPTLMGDDGEVQRDGQGQGGAGDAAVLGEPRFSIKVVRRKA